jgi:hypothetical protein
MPDEMDNSTPNPFRPDALSRVLAGIYDNVALPAAPALPAKPSLPAEPSRPARPSFPALPATPPSAWQHIFRFENGRDPSVPETASYNKGMAAGLPQHPLVSWARNYLGTTGRFPTEDEITAQKRSLPNVAAGTGLLGMVPGGGNPGE